MTQEQKEALILALYPTLKRIVIGRVTTLFQEAKREWKKQHPPVRGGWLCGVCHSYVGRQYLTIDHVVMKLDAPELELTISNFQACHPACNVLRGRIMTDPVFMAEMRGKPEDHWDRVVVERVILQAQVAYRAWQNNIRESRCKDVPAMLK